MPHPCGADILFQSPVWAYIDLTTKRDQIFLRPVTMLTHPFGGLTGQRSLKIAVF